MQVVTRVQKIGMVQTFFLLKRNPKKPHVFATVLSFPGVALEQQRVYMVCGMNIQLYRLHVLWDVKTLVG